MGIGYALATGLIQGFTQNIGREMERSVQAEKDRINKLTRMLSSCVCRQELQQRKRKRYPEDGERCCQQMQARGGIDPFGTRSDDIIDDDAMTNLLGSLKSTVEEDEVEYHNLAIGPAVLKVDEKYVDPQSSPEDHGLWFSMPQHSS